MRVTCVDRHFGSSVPVRVGWGRWRSQGAFLTLGSPCRELRAGRKRDSSYGLEVRSDREVTLRPVTKKV